MHKQRERDCDQERFGNIGFTTRNALHLHTFACVYAVPYINCQSTMYCINYTLLILTVAGFYNAIVENCTILFQLFILKEKSESTLQIDTELCTQATINNRFDWFLSLPNSYYTWSSVNQPAFSKQYHFAVKLLLNKTSISTLKYFYVARCVRVTISR